MISILRESALRNALGVLALCVLLGDTLATQERPPVFAAVDPPLAARLYDSLNAIDVPGGRVVRRRLAHIDVAQLAMARTTATNPRFGGEPTLTLNVFDDVVLLSNTISAGPTASGTGFYLSAQLAGDREDAGPDGWEMSLLVYDQGVTGTIRNAHTMYDIRPLDNTVHVITQLESRLPVVDADPLTLREFPPYGLSTDPPQGRVGVATADQKAEIDILVFYTAAAARGATRLSASTNIVQLVDRMFLDANTAYRNSGAHIQLNLVALEAITYTETPDPGTNFQRLVANGDGHMDFVHNARDIYGADLVHLIVDLTLGRSAYVPFCGVAQISDEFMEGAYGLTQYFCVANYTFAHEVSHNIGLHHDRYQTLRRQGATHGYAHGYVNQRAFIFGAPESSRWRTIMAYDTQCKDFGFPQAVGGQYCGPVRYFSNPDLTRVRQKTTTTSFYGTCGWFEW